MMPIIEKRSNCNRISSYPIAATGYGWLITLQLRPQSHRPFHSIPFRSVLLDVNETNNGHEAKPSRSETCTVRVHVPNGMERNGTERLFGRIHTFSELMSMSNSLANAAAAGRSERAIKRSGNVPLLMRSDHWWDGSWWVRVRRPLRHETCANR